MTRAELEAEIKALKNRVAYLETMYERLHRQFLSLPVEPSPKWPPDSTGALLPYRWPDKWITTGDNRVMTIQEYDEVKIT